MYLKTSWELGTRSQAILELNGTAYSVLSPHSLPPPVKISSSLTDPLAPFFAIARDTVLGRAKANNNTQGPQPLIQGDGSAADPASIGMSVLLANWTRQDNGSVDYAGAAKDQLDYLMQVVPHTSDGAISHRVSEVQLWYMGFPFDSILLLIQLQQERFRVHGASVYCILWHGYSKPHSSSRGVQPDQFIS